MTYSEAFKGLDTIEVERRYQVINRMNILWNKRNSCEDETKRKKIDKQIKAIRMAETSWLREVAYFLYY